MRFNGSWSRVNTAGGNITASGNNDNSTSITDDNSIAIHDDNSITTTTTTSSHPNINSNVHSSISRNISGLNDLRDIHNSNRNRRNRSTTTTTTLVPNSNNTERTRQNSGYQIANNIQSLRHVHRSSSSNNTDFRSSHRRSRRPMIMNSDDDDRSRSRNRNRNRNNTPQNTQTPTPTISIPLFNGIAHGIDKREAENIYRIIHERSSIFCDYILEIIAEFTIGVLYECTNNICSREILTMNSGRTFGGHFQNPQSVIQVNGNIDCNDKLLTFCDSCFVNTRTCGLDLKRWSLRNNFNNNNNGGMIIFNIRGGVSLSDRVNFDRIFCTKKYMDNGVQYCSDCIYGKQLSIGNYNIIIKCDISGRVSSQQYSIGAETHTFYDNGGDSHTNIGG
eukprot:818315_1